MRYAGRRSLPPFGSCISLSRPGACDGWRFLVDLRLLLEPHMARKRIAEAQWSFAVFPKLYLAGGSSIFSWRPATALLCRAGATFYHCVTAVDLGLARRDRKPYCEDLVHSCRDRGQFLDGPGQHHVIGRP